MLAVETKEPAVPLSPTTISELQAELDRKIKRIADIERSTRNLRNEQQELVAEIHAINSILPPMSRVAQVGVPNRLQANFGISPNEAFRTNVRRILQRTGKPMLPIDVQKILEAHGIAAHGATDMRTRVMNEMWKLSKAGELLKSGKTYQWIPKEEK